MLARVPGQALALKVVDEVGAEAAVHAGLAQALVDLLAAVLAPVAGRAGADEVVDGVVAGAAVGAGRGPALVHVLLAR